MSRPSHGPGDCCGARPGCSRLDPKLPAACQRMPHPLGAANLTSRAPELLQRMTFLHVPKTGGTTVEDMIPDRSTRKIVEGRGIRWQRSSSWHLPPDVFATTKAGRLHVYENQTVFSVVREPRERYASEALWRVGWNDTRTLLPLTDDLGAFSAGAAAAAAALAARGRWGAMESESLVHLQPQAWFVWTEAGVVQSGCVIAFEKATSLMAVTRMARTEGRRLAKAPPAPAEADVQPAPPPLLSALYAIDTLLWAAALASPCLCYRPPALPPAYLARLGRLSQEDLGEIKALLEQCA